MHIDSHIIISLNKQIKMKKLFTLLFAVLLFTACNEEKFEKIVILDSMPTTRFDKAIRYKVKRIKYGVITYIYRYEPYEVGDTLLHTFLGRENQLQTRK